MVLREPRSLDDGPYRGRKALRPEEPLVIERRWFEPRHAVTDPTGPAEGTERICRGGSYRSDARFVHPTFRGHNHPGLVADIGFRPGRTLS
jgi:hypothetical protein